MKSTGAESAKENLTKRCLLFADLNLAEAKMV